MIYLIDREAFLHSFDWEGSKIADISLDKRIDFFSVTDQSKIYASITKESKILTFDFNRTL
jgi:hypothetical protein